MHRTDASNFMSHVWVLAGSNKGHVCQCACKRLLKASCRLPSLTRPRRQSRTYQGNCELSNKYAAQCSKITNLEGIDGLCQMQASGPRQVETVTQPSQADPERPC